MPRFVHPVLLVSCWSVGCSITAAAESLTYNRDIRPILTDNCFSCHGQAKQKHGLRLRARAAAAGSLRKGNNAVGSGKVEESELAMRIVATDPEEQMPPPDSGHTLKAAQKETLRRW